MIVQIAGLTRVVIWRIAATQPGGGSSSSSSSSSEAREGEGLGNEVEETQENYKSMQDSRIPEKEKLRLEKRQFNQ